MLNRMGIVVILAHLVLSGCGERAVLDMPAHALNLYPERYEGAIVLTGGRLIFENLDWFLEYQLDSQAPTRKLNIDIDEDISDCAEELIEQEVGVVGYIDEESKELYVVQIIYNITPTEYESCGETPRGWTILAP